MHAIYDKWYDMNEEDSGVVLIENGKILGPHALLCVHALRDTSYLSR